MLKLWANMASRRNIHRQSLRLAFEQIIRHAEFPITTKELANFVLEEAGGDDLAHIAENLPNKLYKTEQQIMDEVKKVVPAL